MNAITHRKVPENHKNLSDLHPLLQKIYSSRGITNLEQINKRLEALLHFEPLLDLDVACERISEAIFEGQKITIVGDFDADGATSTALAFTALKAFGCNNINYIVPNRFKHGYGLTKDLVEDILLNKPDLIITVDSGINCHHGIAHANHNNIDVIVTDHHLQGETLPNAYAIINPNRNDDPFSSKAIAGVGVVFYLMLALRRYLQNSGWFKENNIITPNLADFLDLVALGTVADVVGLDQNNRILVNNGIQRIKNGLARPGISALIKVANKDYHNIRESDLGFSVAPRLNAAGRLDDMSLGIKCLIADNNYEAEKIAAQLDQLNIERREIEAAMKKTAFSLIDELINKLNSQEMLPNTICFMDQSWHQGVIGILAGRLKDKYYRPVIIFAKVSETELKGSARSINNLNIRDVLAEIAVINPNVIKKFGGHAMAAGLSIHPENFNEFSRLFELVVKNHLQGQDLSEITFTDGELTPELLSKETAELLINAGPWGQKFPEPCFDNIFEVIEQRLLVGNHLKLKLQLPNSPDTYDAIIFGVNNNAWPDYRVSKIHMVYKLDINHYQGRSQMQLIGMHLYKFS